MHRTLMINSPRVEKSAKIVKRYRKDKNLGENQNETQTSDWIWTYECEDDAPAENSNSAGVNGKLPVASDANQNQTMPNDSTLVHDSTGMSRRFTFTSKANHHILYVQTRRQ